MNQKLEIREKFKNCIFRKYVLLDREELGRGEKSRKMNKQLEIREEVDQNQRKRVKRKNSKEKKEERNQKLKDKRARTGNIK